MGTRSMIAIQNPVSGTVKAVYCHWDGYLSHNGAILSKHYNSAALATALINLGDISSLGKIIGHKHPFSPHTSPADKTAHDAAKAAGACTFHTRDRGEHAPLKHFGNLAKAAAAYGCSDYLYVFKHSKTDEAGQWFYKRPGERWKKLAPAIDKLNPEECAA